MAVANGVVVPACFTLSEAVSLIDRPGRAAAKGRSVSLGRLQKRHNQGLSQGVV
ncbi:hypothetical protein FOFC_18482 [Fusarium oxysporum]|nr:hypothetical protein FOFC_18482 [Fusarium oxysporum]